MNPNSNRKILVDEDHPWLGLMSFSEQTQRFFYGRDNEIREIFLRAREQSLTVLYGQSGLGKTSLLGAGLLPKLRVEHFRPTLIRLRFDATDPSLLDQVRQALARALAGDNADDLCRQWSAMESLWEIFHRVAIRPPDLEAEPPVLIFDQFEEVFTLGRSENRKADTAIFLNQLAELVENRVPQTLQNYLRHNRRAERDFDLKPNSLRIILTLREDYLSQLEAWKTEMPSLMRNRMPLQRLNGVQALDAVIRPGAMGKIPLVDESVGSRIVCFVARRPAGTPLSEIETVPPLLSLVCHELNEARLAAQAPTITIEQVEHQGADILQNFYDRSFTKLPEAAIIPVRRLVEDRLVSVSGHRNPMALEDAVAELTAAGVPEPAEALASLITGRLLSSEARRGQQRIEITHDVLVPLAVRSREDRRAREHHEKVEAEQRETKKKTIALRRSRNRLRAVAVIMAMLAVAAVISFVFASIKVRQTRSQVQAASRADAAVADLMFEEGEWGPGMAYMGHALWEDPWNNEAAVHFWSAVVYGRRGDGKLPEGNLWYSNNPKGVFMAIGPLGLRALIATTNGTVLKNTTNGAVIRSLGDVNSGNLKKLYFSANGTRLLTLTDSGAHDKRVQIWSADTMAPPLELSEVSDSTLGAAFSQDGTRIVLVSLQGEIAIADLTQSTNLIKLPIQPSGWLNVASFSPEGKYFITGGQTGIARIREWDAPAASEIILSGHESWILDATFSPDGKLVATASADKTARIWDRASGRLLGVLRHERQVNQVAFNGDGSRVLTASDDGTARIWSTNGNLLLPPLQHRSRVLQAAFGTGPNLGKILSRCFDNSVYIWDADTGKRCGEPLQHGRANILKDAVFAASDKAEIVTASADGVGRWNIDFKKPGRLIHQNDKKLWSVHFSSDGQRLLTSGADGCARLWDWQTGKLPACLFEFPAQGAVRSAEFSPDGTLMITASDHGASIWSATNGILKWQLLKSNTRTAKFNPQGNRVITTCLNRLPIIWDLNANPPSPTVLTNDADILDASFSRDGQQVVMASLSRAAIIWNVANLNRCRIVHSLTNSDRLSYAAYSPDGSHVVTCCYDGTTRIWDTATGKKIRELQQQEEDRERVTMARFSPDGMLLAAVSTDGTLGLCAVTANAESNQFNLILRLKDKLNTVDFSPHGDFLLVASSDGTTCLYKVDKAKARLTRFCEPFPQDGDVVQACFSPDGQYIAAVSDDGTAGVWRIPPLVDWGDVMNQPLAISNASYPWTVGEALTAAISGYRINSAGQIDQVSLNRRFDLQTALSERLRGQDEWNALFKWWQISPEVRPPWPPSVK